MQAVENFYSGTFCETGLSLLIWEILYIFVERKKRYFEQ